MAGDRLCVLQVHERYGSAGYNCRPRGELLTTGVVLFTDTAFNGGGPWRLVVALPDGYTRAQAGRVAVPVTANVAVLEVADLDDLGRGTLDVSGRGLPTVAFPLEEMIGPFPR